MGKKAGNNSIFCYSGLLLGNELCGLDLKADQFAVQVSRITDGVYPSSWGLLYCWTGLGECMGEEWILSKDIFPRHALWSSLGFVPCLLWDLKSNIPLLFVVLIGMTASVIWFIQKIAMDLMQFSEWRTGSSCPVYLLDPAVKSIMKYCSGRVNLNKFNRADTMRPNK